MLPYATNGDPHLPPDPQRNHQLACFCPGCRRWATCNLPEFVAAGLCARNPARSGHDGGSADRSASGSSDRQHRSSHGGGYNDETPALAAGGVSEVVAGAGFEPATFGL